MSLKKWERDVLNRQRNIVFPDTVLNEGRFYRNIVYEKAVFSRGQKVSLLIVPMYFLIILSAGIAGAISQVLYKHKDNARFPSEDVWICLYLLAWMLFWTFLAVQALFPVSPPSKRRRGNRR
ncbi:MAG TPA: hypothetical protein VNZ47_02920 [Candidatus Dormibacteraeota bacterium]|nr:hypothetical protein [Candidatus Dormibacteraeota bacterium]